MEEKMLHTPEGVRDIYNNECKRKLMLQDEMHRVFVNYGFHDIQTPTFEYFDIFSREVGTTPSKDLFKFFDREGNTLVLRPDFTPSVVRSAAKYYGDMQLPVRLCYGGSAFINESAVYQGRLKETTQMGVELFGDDSVEADAEMIALMADTLKASGLTKFQIEIGEVDFFKGLLEEAGFSEEEGDNLRTLISQKSFFGIEEMLSAKSMDHNLKQVFLRLTEAFGSIDKIREAETWTKNPRSVSAIKRLLRLYEILKTYGCEQYVSFDLGMLSKYKYYTGIIFKAFTYGIGQALATGGRYDNLMRYFGKSSPAVGFVVFVDHLMSAIYRQKMPLSSMKEETLIVYEAAALAEAVSLAKKLRTENSAAAMLRRRPEKPLPEYAKQAAEMGARVLYINETGKSKEL